MPTPVRGRRGGKLRETTLAWAERGLFPMVAPVMINVDNGGDDGDDADDGVDDHHDDHFL